MWNPSSLKIFWVYSQRDKEKVEKLQGELVEAGFRPLWDLDALRHLPLGSNWRAASKEKAARLLDESEIVLVALSQGAIRDDAVAQGVRTAKKQGKTIIPVHLETSGYTGTPPDLAFLHDLIGVFLPENGVDTLIKGLQRIAEDDSLQLSEAHTRARSANATTSLQVCRITLKNIRCFEAFDLKLTDESKKPTPFTVVLGDNAAGKSTLLRSIALGLSSESEASALIKQLPGTFVRRGAEEGSIRLELFDPDNGQKLSVITRIHKNGSTDERIRKETAPDPFPWQNVFLCGYGTNRSRQAAASHETYTLHQAVLSLFDEDALLQNPEVVLLRQDLRLRNELERRLLRILMFDDGYKMAYPRTGPEIQGAWGEQPLQALSDGYRSTTQWVLDFLGWSIYAGRLDGGDDIGGILIIDELEQHLHPRWQRYIVQRLCQLFPETQIFASTHTPLVAAGAVDVEASRLLRLKTQGTTVSTVEIPPSSLAGLRADQILASEAFGLNTTRNPGSEDDISHYTELMGKEGDRTPEEESEMERLGAVLERALRTGESEAEREVEQAVETVLKDRVSAIKPELLDLEVRRQLHELFGGDQAD